MKSITQKFELALYGYNPKEFMPVWYGDELLNKRQFVIYKVRRAAKRCGLTYDNMMAFGNKVDAAFTNQGTLLKNRG